MNTFKKLIVAFYDDIFLYFLIFLTVMAFLGILPLQSKIRILLITLLLVIFEILVLTGNKLVNKDKEI